MVNISARGLVVAPGFIDIHSHSDLSVRDFPDMENILKQGVTTQVVGNCGINIGMVEGSLGNFIEELQRRGIGTNLIFLAGQGVIRSKAMGNEKRKPTEEELNKMKELLELTLEEGAKGLSTGLEYEPGAFSSTEELIELAKVVSRRGGIYATHLRNEGDYLEAAVEEAIKIGKLAEIPVQISHLKVERKRNWGKSKKIIEMIESARINRVDVSYDIYPYTAYMTRLNIAILPFRASSSELDDPYKYREALEELKASRIDWDLIHIPKCDIDNRRNGKSILELARDSGISPEEFTLELLKRNEPVRVISFQMNEEDIKTFLSYKYSFIGSDGSSYKKRNEEDRTHPRSFGTFPRILRRYVRELNILSLEEAIAKMTYLPAKKLGITDRGIIKEGAYADITIFDPENIKDKATYDDPFQYPEGIEYVILNGNIVIEKGNYNNKRAGVVIR
ncbi:amidohydrolase family protein [bacterium]|nr:amidohydrolase family protein [bacterium]